MSEYIFKRKFHLSDTWNYFHTNQLQNDHDLYFRPFALLKKYESSIKTSIDEHAKAARAYKTDIDIRDDAVDIDAPSSWWGFWYEVDLLIDDAFPKNEVLSFASPDGI